MSVLPRKQTSVSCAADCDIIRCYRNTKLTDQHLTSTVHGVDDEIIGWLIIANQFLETDLEKLRAAVSTGYARGKLRLFQ
jgi:hypothetical protein